MSMNIRSMGDEYELSSTLSVCVSYASLNPDYILYISPLYMKHAFIVCHIY